MALLKLDEAPVTDLDVFANPSDLRRDLHILVDYVRTHQIKRGHRDNLIPQAHRRRLAGLMSDPAAAAKPDEWGDFPWIEHVDWLSLALKFVRYDTEGTYAGFTSSEPCYPESTVPRHDGSRSAKPAALLVRDDDLWQANAINRYLRPGVFLVGPLRPARGLLRGCDGGSFRMTGRIA